MEKSFTVSGLESSSKDRLGHECFFFSKWLKNVKRSFVCISKLRGIDLETFKRC